MTIKKTVEKCVLCGMPTGRFWVGVRSKTNKNAVLCTWCIHDIRSPNFMNSLYGDINPRFEFSTINAKKVNSIYILIIYILIIIRKYYKPNLFKRDSKGKFIKSTESD